jgi:putative transcriptional regulator
LQSQIDTLQSYQHQILIANPSLDNSWFEKAVIYIAEDNEQQTTGLVLNKPHEFQIKNLLDYFNFKPSAPSDYLAARPELNDYVRLGGPADKEHGFILHRHDNEWPNSIALDDGLILSTSEAFLKAIAENEAEHPYLVFLGVSSWHPGQLTEEIQRNSWLTCPYDPAIVFDVPFEDHWQLALASLGIDPAFLSSEAGHA